MAEKKITIAFAKGGILPASVMGAKTDTRVAAHEAVRVPEAYARHLIDDRFAYEVLSKGAEKSGASKDDGKGSKVSKDAEVAEATKAVEDAEAALGEAGDDMVAKAAAEDALAKARAAFDALKA